jgi:hypothetical protein
MSHAPKDAKMTFQHLKCRDESLCERLNIRLEAVRMNVDLERSQQ